MLPIVGWVLAVVIGIGLIWLGFVLSKQDQESAVVQPSATLTREMVPPTTTPLPLPTAPDSPIATDMPLPTATLELTEVPATATPVTARIVAGADGVNVRTGPGTNYTRIGYIDPGGQAPVIGYSSDWWQIQYTDDPGWVIGRLVTAHDADGVPEVEPPTAPTESPAPPTSPTTAPTEVPPTQEPANYRGLVPNDFQVEGAPGPYGAGADIWFNLWITNQSSATVEYRSLGVVVEETGQYQESFSYSEIEAGKQFQHRDCITITAPGTYNLWLTIGFYDEAWFRMLGPITVNVQ